MKYKHLAMIMGVMITATSVGSAATAFAADSKTESTQDAEDTTEDTAEASDTEESNEILGEVKSVEDGKITIAVGTRKEMGQPGEQPQGDGNGEAPEKPDGDDAKADGDAKDSEDAGSEKTDDASTDDTDSTDEASDDKTDKGESPAAIRSDRGGGTMVVDGGTYTSNGVGSPAVYCTADIAVNNAELTANGSEAVCIEGLNSLRLYNSNLTGNMSDDDQNDTTWTVILYQSMSGDSEVGNSTFQMDGGTITSKNGGLFYTTNTECTIALKDVDITYNDDSEFFLQCTGNNNQRGWGQSGANGSDCNFTADSQDMKGNVIWDSISNLDFYMTNGSTLEGAFVNDESNAGNGGDGYCNVVIDKDSTWTVTGDSTITSLSNAGTITDADGKTVSIVGTDGTTYVEGDSDYTITVGSYQDSADTSNATAIDDWSNYEVERPENL